MNVYIYIYIYIYIRIWAQETRRVLKSQQIRMSAIYIWQFHENVENKC